jgi:hypothetical protein
MENSNGFDPDLRIVFEPGTHAQAVKSYAAGWAWLLQTGIAERAGLYGLLYAPTHPLVPTAARYAVPGVLAEPLWSVKIEIQVDSDETLEWLGCVKPPENAWFEMVMGNLI